MFSNNTCYVISNFSQLLPLFDIDHLEIKNYSNLNIVFYFLGDFGQVLLTRPCHEDVIMIRKSFNCTGIDIVQGDYAGGSKLIEQVLLNLSISHWKISC